MQTHHYNLIKSSIETNKKQSSRERERESVDRFSMHNLYCTAPGVFLDRKRQYWGVSFWTESVNTGELKVPDKCAGEFICAERCIVGFY